MTRSPPARASAREDLLVQPVGEVGVLGVRAQVGEGQHREPGSLAERRAHQPLPGLLCAHGQSDTERECDPERGDAPDGRGRPGRGDGRRAGRGLAAQTCAAEIERPGQHERHRQAEHGGDDHRTHRPLRQAEPREHGVRDLDGEPREAAVPGRGAKHLSATKFRDDGHGASGLVGARLRIPLARARFNPRVVAQDNPRQTGGKPQLLDLWKGREYWFRTPRIDRTRSPARDPLTRTDWGFGCATSLMTCACIRVEPEVGVAALQALRDSRAGSVSAAYCSSGSAPAPPRPWGRRPSSSRSSSPAPASRVRTSTPRARSSR